MHSKAYAYIKPFNEITAADIRFDFHMHTNQTDGQDSPEAMAEAVQRSELDAAAVTEHVTIDSDWWPDFFEHLREIREFYQIPLFIGIEAKALDFEGRLDAVPATIESAEICVGSVHRFPDGRGGQIALPKVLELGAEEAARIEYEAALGLVRNSHGTVDVLGHPFGIYSTFYKRLPEEYFHKLCAAAAETGIAVEVSTKYYPDRSVLYQILRDTNPLVSFGSDAHSVNEIARSFTQLRSEIGI